MVLKNALRSQSGAYDFADNGGDIGIINLLVHLPRFAQVVAFYATSIVVPVGINPATISFGFLETEGLAPAVDAAAYMVPNPPGAFPLGVPLAGVDLWANPIKHLTTTDVVCALFDPGLSAGTIDFTIVYTENVR